jgi:glycosyltransferase involved in cell wall biosynthesis
MEVAARLLERRPRAIVLVAGSDGASYGPDLHNETWWERTSRWHPTLDHERIVRVGRVPHSQMRAILQLSTVHLYWSYPFVLSRSLWEAMASGAAVAGSRTANVGEIAHDGESGFLVGFFDYDAWLATIGRVFDMKEQQRLAPPGVELNFDRVRRNARQAILDYYDTDKLLPKHIDLVNQLADGNRYAEPQDYETEFVLEKMEPWLALYNFKFFQRRAFKSSSDSKQTSVTLCRSIEITLSLFCVTWPAIS